MSCYMVAEKTIEAIIEEPGLSAKLEGAAFTTLHERLAESVNAIVALILAMKDDGVVLDVQPAHPTPAPRLHLHPDSTFSGAGACLVTGASSRTSRPKPPGTLMSTVTARLRPATCRCRFHRIAAAARGNKTKRSLLHTSHTFGGGWSTRLAPKRWHLVPACSMLRLGTRRFRTSW